MFKEQSLTYTHSLSNRKWDTLQCGQWALPAGKTTLLAAKEQMPQWVIWHLYTKGDQTADTSVLGTSNHSTSPLKMRLDGLAKWFNRWTILVLATKTKECSSILRTHTMERENQLPQLSSHQQMHACRVHTCAHMHTHTQKWFLKLWRYVCMYVYIYFT